MAISPLDKDKEPSSSSSCLPSLVESINNYNSIAGNFAAQKREKKRSDVEKSEKEHVYCLFTPKGMSAHDVATSHQRKKKKMECVARQKKSLERDKKAVGRDSWGAMPFSSSSVNLFASRDLYPNQNSLSC